jgi:hypothetical protein
MAPRAWAGTPRSSDLRRGIGSSAFPGEGAGVRLQRIVRSAYLDRDGSTVATTDVVHSPRLLR